MIYVVSDLHGQYELFRRTLQLINFSQNDKVYVIGDVIDRGPDSIRLLRDILATPNMKLLIGNHELMMLRAIKPDGSIANIESFTLWTSMNGGQITHEQYMRLPIETRYELYNALLNKKLTTKISVNNKTYYLTHACPALNYIDIPVQDIPVDVSWDSVWKSPYRKGDDTEAKLSEYPTDGTTIMGHVPVASYHHHSLTPLYNAHTIDIDGGCAQGGDFQSDHTGVMIYRIDDDKTFSLSFEDMIAQLLDAEADDQQFIDALGIYIAAPILNMRAKYSKYRY